MTRFDGNRAADTLSTALKEAATSSNPLPSVESENRTGKAKRSMIYSDLVAGSLTG